MFRQAPRSKQKVAIVGAGPAGLSAAQELGYAGFDVTIFEAHPYPGGMVGGAIPSYRLPQEQIDQDMAVLEGLGVDIRYGQKAGVDFTVDDLRRDGYVAVFIAVGAQLAKRLDIEGEDSEGILDALTFLRSVREGDPVPIGARVGVIGAGDTAMDCVRSSRRVGAEAVSMIYRRTIDQMPADREEIHEALAENITIVELATPSGLHIEDGKLAGLICTRTEYRGDRDASGRKIPHEVPDSEFEIPLDTLILAISQHSVLDFFGDEVPEVTSKGYIRVDPDTFESTVPGVYAGGDVAEHGPSSIVKAAGDGKRVAAAIAAAHGAATNGSGHVPQPVNLHDMVIRRARREYRKPVVHTPLSQRVGFDETILTYTPEQAKAEASRCLDCHDICSLCVGVCPNMALMTYEMDPVKADLPALRVEGGAVVPGEAARFVAGQQLQIAVLTDFCNECGNCTTACPTAGRPFVDKPRLYLDRDDFMAEKTNAFMLFADGSMEARVDGETHRIAVNGAVEYTAPSFSARLDPATLALLEATPNGSAADGEVLSLRPAADMYTLWKGLRGSMAHLPAMAEAGTRIGHPGYAD